MPTRPSLSLCIPTYNRAVYLEGALATGLREAASQSPGTVEILVCDNASTDETWNLLTRIQVEHPELRVLRNSENIGFDRNYLRCIEEARGEFVWILGDDDVWLPGSIARVLRELEAGADACLCLAEACDLDLNPLLVLPWFLDSDPPSVWDLKDRSDLIRYFNACARNAAAFAFISVAIFRKDRFLLNRESLQRALGIGYTQVWGMMEFLRQPTRLHYIPEPLIRNRMSDTHADSYASQDLYSRWMIDLIGWANVADAVFGEDKEVHDAFSRILGRNHHNTILPGIRQQAATENAWQYAVPYLVRAGFSPVQIATVNFGFQHLQGHRLPMPTLDPATLCLADLPLVTRGAQRIAVLALGGIQNVLDGAGLLAALRDQGGPERIRVFCTSACSELLEGFEVQSLDPKRYGTDTAYGKSIAQNLIDFSPELVVNLDPERSIESDDLVAAALPAGAIAFDLPDRGQDEELISALNGTYARLIPQYLGTEALRQALGLKGHPASLWPSTATREEAQGVLAGLGWDPARTLAILVDHPSIAMDPAFQSALAEAGGNGWTLVGIGGQGTYPSLATLLDPWQGQAVNLAGGLSLGSMAALLQLCGGYLGGTALLQSMARACACAPYTRGGR